MKKNGSLLGEIQMKIKIKNVAKILDAEIVSNGITVIAGLNNTGKSTILKSFYATENIFRNSNMKVAKERKKSLNVIINKCESYFDEKGYEKLPKDLLDDFYHLLSKNMNKLVDNPEDFDYFKELFDSILIKYADNIHDNLIYTEEFLTPIYDKVKTVFVRPKEDYMKYIGEKYIRSTFDNQLNNAQNLSEASIRIESENNENYIYVIDNKIVKMSYGFIDKPDVIYLPAYNMLDCLKSNIRMFLASNYSAEQQIFEYLYTRPFQNESSYEEYSEIEDNIKIIKDILQEAIHGNLKKSISGELSYEDNEIDAMINIKNVASGIKNFLIIQSLVEHGKLKRNSVLLIDEPETNLHPEWHIVFAEILVLMYKNMGVISIVNSHSPYFIRALEVKMADYGIKDKGTYYLMEKNDMNGYVVQDVTNETDKIYKKLYKPLEYL